MKQRRLRLPPLAILSSRHDALGGREATRRVAARGADRANAGQSGVSNKEYPEPYWIYGYPPDYEADIYDDDYWRWVRLSKPVLQGFLHIERRSKELQAEAESERIAAERLRGEVGSVVDGSGGADPSEPS